MTTHLPAVPADDESIRLMAELSIVQHGRHYHFEGYRYEQLADAVAYAQLIHARQGAATERALAQFAAVESLQTVDEQLMRELSISFENGSFVFAGYRYERLIDAANYARHLQQIGVKT